MYGKTGEPKDGNTKIAGQGRCRTENVECGKELDMQNETDKQILSTLNQDNFQNSTDVLKYGNQALQKALHVFTIIKLEKAAVTEGKTEHKILGFVMKPAVFIKISGSKICLTFAGMMHKRNVAIGSL